MLTSVGHRRDKHNKQWPQGQEYEMVDEETQAHIKELVDVFKISEEKAHSLVESHDTFVESLADLNNDKAAVTYSPS